MLRSRLPNFLFIITSVIVLSACNANHVRGTSSPYKNEMLERIGMNDCISPCWQEIELNEPVPFIPTKFHEKYIASDDGSIPSLETSHTRVFRWRESENNALVTIIVDKEDDNVEIIKVLFDSVIEGQPRATLKDFFEILGDPQSYFAASSGSPWAVPTITYTFFFEEAHIVIKGYEFIDHETIEFAPDETDALEIEFLRTIIPEDIIVQQIYFYDSDSAELLLEPESTYSIVQEPLNTWISNSEILVKFFRLSY